MRTVYHINSTWASTAPGQKLMHMIYEIYVFLQINMAFKSILAIILTSTKKIPPWVLQSALLCEQMCEAFTLDQFFSLPHFLNTGIKINFTTNSSITPTLICSQCRCNVDTELLLARGDGNNESRAYSQPPLSPPTSQPARPREARTRRRQVSGIWAYMRCWSAPNQNWNHVLFFRQELFTPQPPSISLRPTVRYSLGGKSNAMELEFNCKNFKSECIAGMASGGTFDAAWPWTCAQI